MPPMRIMKVMCFIFNFNGEIFLCIGYYKLYLFKRLVSLPFAFVYMLFGGASIKENFQMLASLPIDPKNPKS
jgi:hypothetical protein